MKYLTGVLLAQLCLLSMPASARIRSVPGFSGVAPAIHGVQPVSLVIKDIGRQEATVSVIFGAGLPHITTAERVTVSDGGPYTVWQNNKFSVATNAPATHDPATAGTFKGTLDINLDAFTPEEKSQILEDIGAMIPESDDNRVTKAYAIMKALAETITLAFQTPIRY
jgi:hypothetical protein